MVSLTLLNDFNIFPLVIYNDDAETYPRSEKDKLDIKDLGILEIVLDEKNHELDLEKIVSFLVKMLKILFEEEQVF